MLIFHTVTSVLALVAGFPIFFSTKGTRFHKRWGKVYVASMLSLCISSFWLTDTTPFTEGFDVFHVMALVSLASLAGGVIPLFFKHRSAGWWQMHYFFILYSYVGLVLALGSHFFVYMPESLTFASRAALLWGGPYVIGTILIYWRLPLFKTRFSTAAS